MHTKAPVMAVREVRVAAVRERVWSILTSIEQWHLWNPQVQWAELRGQLMPGTRFIWKAGAVTITSTIQKVEFERYISWTGKTPGIIAAHAWSLAAVDGGTQVRTEESWQGWLPWLLRGMARKRLEAALESGVMYLKAEAERG